MEDQNPTPEKVDNGQERLDEDTEDIIVVKNEEIFDESPRIVGIQYNSGGDIEIGSSINIAGSDLHFGRELVFQGKLPKRQTLREYKEYVLSRISSYDKQASFLKTTHNLLQIIIFAGAALVTTIVGIPEVPKLIPAIISGIVTIATAVTNYYKFGEHSRDLFLTSRDMALEYNQFTTKRGMYKDLSAEQAISLFMDRIEALLYVQTERSQSIGREKSAGKHKGDIV